MLAGRKGAGSVCAFADAKEAEINEFDVKCREDETAIWR